MVVREDRNDTANVRSSQITSACEPQASRTFVLARAYIGCGVPVLRSTTIVLVGTQTFQYLDFFGVRRQPHNHRARITFHPSCVQLCKHSAQTLSWLLIGDMIFG